MADVTLAAQAVEDAPLAYPIPGAAELLLKLLTADYDGTGAGGDYVPCVQITLADGTVAGTFPLQTTVAEGSSVDVSWFPNGGLRGAGGGGGNGLQYGGADPPTYGPLNSGDWLNVTTNVEQPFGYGMTWLDNSGGGWQYQGNGGGVQFLDIGTPAGPMQFQTASDVPFTIGSTSNVFESSGSGSGSQIVASNGPFSIQANGDFTATATGGNVKLPGLPTSAAGLPSGALWNNAGVVNVV